MQKYISPVLGVLYGMFVLEGHVMCKATWHTYKKYNKDPHAYGLNQWTRENCHHRPVLLLHGAVGSWSYLGDLAVSLKNENIPVFVIDLGHGLPTEDTRQKIINKIKDIRRLYYHFNHRSSDKSDSISHERQSLCNVPEETSLTEFVKTTHVGENLKVLTNTASVHNCPLVDIVAHSNGGNLALFSAFTEDCSYIDRHGQFKFRSAPEVNSHVGKVITVALPADETDTNLMRDIDKLDDLFNINATFDAIMDYKKCQLINELPSHVNYVDAGHIGIVYKRATLKRILELLND